MLSAIMNSWGNLVKRRPSLMEFVVSSIMHWSPTQLKNRPYLEVRSVEKSVRILLTHISRWVALFLLCSPDTEYILGHLKERHMRG